MQGNTCPNFFFSLLYFRISFTEDGIRWDFPVETYARRKTWRVAWRWCVVLNLSPTDYLLVSGERWHGEENPRSVGWWLKLASPWRADGHCAHPDVIGRRTRPRVCHFPIEYKSQSRTIYLSKSCKESGTLLPKCQCWQSERKDGERYIELGQKDRGANTISEYRLAPEERLLQRAPLAHLIAMVLGHKRQIKVSYCC